MQNAALSIVDECIEWRGGEVWEALAEYAFLQLLDRQPNTVHKPVARDCTAIILLTKRHYACASIQLAPGCPLKMMPASEAQPHHGCVEQVGAIFKTQQPRKAMRCAALVIYGGLFQHCHALPSLSM